MEPQSTRDHLLQVGLRQIHARGYSSTGVNEILEDAKIPKGSFYHHFASKEDFAKEVLALYVLGEGERAEKILHGGKAAPLKRLRRYFEELIKVYGPQAAISGCMVGNLTLEMADHSEAGWGPRRRRHLRVLQQRLEHARRPFDQQRLGARRPKTQGCGAPENPSAAELMQ